ncbi:MAG: DUF4960 domain-containing protein, partial [Prevotella sp.]|nr:DUF4960 domain-containing protein [Prevotella sp.]
MKTKILFVISLIAAVCGLTACSDDISGSVNVSGDCAVEELTLNDQYKATINTSKRLVKVKVPVDFDKKSDMVITSMRISDGAKANMKVGDHINLQADQSLHIANGDVITDWQLAVRNDEAQLKLFILEGVKGAISEENKTVTVSVTSGSGIDLSNAQFEAQCSEDAVCLPASGSRGDFTKPFVLTIRDNTAEEKYTVNVEQIEYPVAIFVGNAETVEELNVEEKAAAKWLTANIAGAAYVSFSELADNAELLKECKLIFFHRHTPAYGNFNDFKSSETAAMAALPILKEYWKNGGGFVLERMGVDLAAALGAMPEDGCPNNCWGGSGEGSDKMGEKPWSLPVFDKTHPLWKDFTVNPSYPTETFTLDPDYTICNSASQYHWDGISGDNLFQKFDEVTGGKAR